MIHAPLVVLVPENPALAAQLAPLRVGTVADLAGGGSFAWVFVDLLLAEGSGLEFCRRLRASAEAMQARIVLVLDDDDAEMRRRALRAGADDYLIGPLQAEQITQRVGLGAPPAPRPAELAHGAIRLDRAAHQVRAGGTRVAMGPNEFNVLAYFLDNRDRVISRTELIGAVRGEAAPLDERTVDVWIGRLRRALGEAGANLPIRTVRQLGYVLDS